MTNDERFDRLEELFQSTFDSLKQEVHQGFGEVKGEIQKLDARMDRMETRLGKIAAGAHYVSRLVEWSEKQDLFQADTLRRLNDLADRVKRLEGGAAA
jgi:hypothetical protein